MADRKKLKNPNGLILGTPGSGKSFAAKREMANAILVKDRFHTDKAEKERLLKEQKKLYDKNDELSKKKRIEFENYKFGKISREAFIGLKDQLEESTEENNERIKAIDKELKESGNIDSLTKQIVAKYIKTIYISAKGIEKIEYC